MCDPRSDGCCWLDCFTSSRAFPRAFPTVEYTMNGCVYASLLSNGINVVAVGQFIHVHWGHSG